MKIAAATGGAKFDETTDGSDEMCIARVTIVEDDQVRSLADRAVELFRVNQQPRARLGVVAGQFSAAVSVNGDDDGDGVSPGVGAWIGHIIALPWKLLFACIPPTTFAAGWVCFVVSIVFIGFVTAIIGDLASLLGCVLGWEDSIVAITLVALGTSLPDTFASKTAAVSDSRADAAVGNVTGSNAVNVFLGLGISWVLGAFCGRRARMWRARHLRRRLEARQLYKGLGVMKVGDLLPGLAVPAGSLGFGGRVYVGRDRVHHLAHAAPRRLRRRARRPAGGGPSAFSGCGCCTSRFR